MRAASLLIAVLSVGCATDAPPPTSPVVVEIVGDGPVVHPRRRATSDAWLIALDALNASPERPPR